MGYLPLLLSFAIVLSLPGARALSSEEQTLQKVFADLIIRLKKWIHDNEAVLKKGMGAIRKHLAMWGMGFRPPNKPPSSRWAEKTSNNIRPKPITRPKGHRDTKPTFRPRPKVPTKQLKIPRWNPPKRSRLSKSPYNPEYFRTHRRVGRSVVPLEEFQRDYTIMQCLEILNELYTIIHSVAPPHRTRALDNTEEILEQNKRDLNNMSMDQLKDLVKKLQNAQDNVKIDKQAGTVTIDGKVVSIENIGSICCPFG